MVKAKNTLEQGIHSLVKCGNQTNFWWDKWLDDQYLAIVLNASDELVDVQTKAREYWELERGWKWESMPQNLIEYIRSKIKLYVLSEENNDEDGFYWSKENLGMFSIKSAYYIILMMTIV